MASLLPRTPKDITLTPIAAEGNSVIDASVNPEDESDDGGGSGEGAGLEEDKMLFAGFNVPDLTPVVVENVAVDDSSMANLFAEHRVNSDAIVIGVQLFLFL